MAANSELLGDMDFFGQEVNEEEVRRENRSREWADGARYIHWVGIVFLGVFLLSFLNAFPGRVNDLNWQLNLISLLMAGGAGSLLGSLLICVARLFNFSDRQIQNRALLVRTLASWVAIGWLLLIPLQLYLGVRLISSQSSKEINEIKTFESIARSVRNSTTEDELRAAMARVPNQPPLPRLSLPLEIAKANLLAQFQKNINSFKNRQEENSSKRWQTWMKELVRNTAQCSLLCIGYLALGKNRLFSTSTSASRTSSRSR